MSAEQPTLPGLPEDIFEGLNAVCGEADRRFGWWVWPRCPSPDHHGDVGPMLRDRRATVWKCVSCHASGDLYDLARLAGGGEA